MTGKKGVGTQNDERTVLTLGLTLTDLTAWSDTLRTTESTLV